MAPGDATAGSTPSSTSDDVEWGGSAIEIRPAVLGDLDAIHELHVALAATETSPFTQLSDNEKRVAWELKRLRKQLMAQERYICFVARRDDTTVGYCAGTLEQSPPIFAVQHYGSIAELYVAEDARRHGIATELLGRVVESFVARGVRQLEATISPTQEGARELLEGLGFSLDTMSFSLDLATATSGESDEATSAG